MRKVWTMLVYRLENFRAKLILDALVLCEQVKSARERIRRRIHTTKDEGSMRKPETQRQSCNSYRDVETYAICPRSSSSGSLSSSFALIFACTERVGISVHGLFPNPSYVLSLLMMSLPSPI